MSVVEALILGIVQGLTEFLPISSTAHLRVVPALIGWEDPGVAYSAVIQLGSVLAVLAYFGRDLATIGMASARALVDRQWHNQHLRLLAAVALGTLPISVIGLALKGLLEQPHGPFRSLPLIAAASIIMGLLLAAAEKLGSRRREISDMGPLDGFIVGLGQALALVPGCSRSGSTLTFALFLNMKRDDAARFSFLLGIPAIILSGLLELRELVAHGVDQTGWINLAAGFCTSTVVSYLSIAWLIRFLSNHSTWCFVAYRLVFGTGVLALSFAGLVS
ncbi:MAG TPA: undecaprenyl-diphosphate phosphatase [Candidatus Obscuribacterales bacterium]